MYETIKLGCVIGSPIVDIGVALQEISALSVDERLQLVEAIWDSIAAEPEQLPLSAAQRDELERRIAAHDRSPDDVVLWDEVRAQALERSRR